MQATKIGMMTEAELKKIAKRKMDHHRLIFYETADVKIHILSHKKRMGYIPLQVAARREETKMNPLGRGKESNVDNPEAANTEDLKSDGFYPNLDEVDL